jgi:hypothetical protein
MIQNISIAAVSFLKKLVKESVIEFSGSSIVDGLKDPSYYIPEIVKY